MSEHIMNPTNVYTSIPKKKKKKKKTSPTPDLFPSSLNTTQNQTPPSSPPTLLNLHIPTLLRLPLPQNPLHRLPPILRSLNMTARVERPAPHQLRVQPHPLLRRVEPLVLKAFLADGANGVGAARGVGDGYVLLLWGLLGRLRGGLLGFCGGVGEIYFLAGFDPVLV